MEMTIKTEVKAPATSSAHIDIDMDFMYLKQEPGLVRSMKSEPALLVKEEILKDSSQAGNEQQCVQCTTSPAGTGRLNEDCGTSLGDVFNVKHESEDIDIEPTVLQHMDIHYTINKNMSAVTGQNTIVDDCNKGMPCSGVKKESRVEDKLRASHKYSSQKITEDDKAHSSLRQQMNFQQHCLRQQRTTRSTDFKCETTIHKPHLHNKVNQRNSRKNSMMTSSIVAAPSNQKRDEKTKTKQKPHFRDKGYSANAAKFAQEVTKQMRVCTGEKPYLCDTCDTRFKRRSELTTHLRVYTSEKPYRCDTCDKRFKLRDNLTALMKVHTGDKPYSCDTCDARFKLRGNLTAHMKVHMGDKPYSCDTCDAKFKRRHELTVHKMVHTGEKPYRCDTCDKRFNQRGHLTVHMRVHTGEKPYRCDTCFAIFKRRSELKMHMRVHMNEKPFRCETCDKRFNQRGHLTVHMKGHMGEKPYSCDTCDARFKQRHGLIYHMMVHTGEKPYRCDTCDKRFKQRGQLTVHMRVHTGEKPYQCDKCDKRFKQRGELTIHMRVHTGQKSHM